MIFFVLLVEMDVLVLLQMKYLVGYLLVDYYVVHNKNIVNGWIINVLMTIMIVNKLKQSNNVYYINLISVYFIIINVLL